MKRWILILLTFIALCLPAWLILKDYSRQVKERNKLATTNNLIPTANMNEDAKNERLLHQVLDKAIGQTQNVDMPSITLPQAGLYNRFNGLLQLLNGSELTFYDSLNSVGEIDWDVYQNIIKENTISFTKVDTLNSSMKVFGWHPYWMGTAHESYNYDLLTHVSWFAYHIDPQTGGYTNPEVIEEWRSTPMIDQALATKDTSQGECQVLLTIANHTPEGNRIFLQNQNRQQERLIDTLLILLDERKAHGIDVNFELVPDGLQWEMTNFLLKLSDRLHANDKMMTLVLPKVNLPVGRSRKGWKAQSNSPYLYDIERLREKIDYFIITGYDFHTGNSQTDGPIAPLRSRGPYSIEKCVYSYLKGGLPRDKLILGLPYYGAVWSDQSGQLRNRDTAFTFHQHLTYRAIQAKYGRTHQQSYDRESWSAYYIVARDSNTFEKVWFDDTLTLDRKYQWVEDEGLAGVGIWALGYDNGTTELWELLAKHRNGGEAMAIKYMEPAINSWFFNVASTLFGYRNIVIIIGLSLAFVFVLGLAVAIFDWRVRDVFFENKTLRIVYVVSGVAVLFGIYYFLLYVARNTDLEILRLFPFALGLIIGGVLAILIYYWFNRHRKQLP